MILQSKPRYVRPMPGQLREVIKFAWWPKHVEDKVIWLEKYIEIERMVERPRTVFIGKYPIIVPWGWDYVETKLIR